MKRKSILLLTNAYPDFPSSYRGVFIKKIAFLFKVEGWEVYVVTPKIYRKSDYVEVQEGVRVFRFPFFAKDRLLIEYEGEGIPYFKMVTYYMTGTLLTLYVMLRYRCQLIHAHWAIPTGPVGVVVGALLGKPLIVTTHGSDLRIAISQGSFLRRIFIWVCQKARRLICVSEGMRQELESMGIDMTKTTVLPMGVDESFFEMGMRRKRSLSKRDVVILSNRNLQPIYNVSQLIKAIPMVLEENPNVKFWIAGEGREKEHLQNKVDELGVSSSVQFLGRIPHEKMPDLLGETDIYVSTSTTDGTSVSLLEAMASGAFPVVTDISANREWITDGKNGFLVPTGNEAFLAKKIVEALGCPELRATALERNRVFVEEKGAIREHARQLTNLYAICFG
jgi:glycosyltransferase involved in cell wall biosynthesis